MALVATVEPGVFTRFDPRATPVPVVFDVSRSGREYPPDFRSPLSFTEVHDNASVYMDDFYSVAPDYGAALLVASFPNTYIDANRPTNDVDPEVVDGEWPGGIQQTGAGSRGLGLIKTKSRYGHPFQEHPLSVADIQRRIDQYWTPYHTELGRIIRDTRERHGLTVQVSCHCMSAVGMPTHPDPGEPRADFCIGDMNGTTADPKYTDFLVSQLKAEGYSVTVNHPYNGGVLMSRYADPANGIHSLMIEINKKRFMDIETFKLNDGAPKIRETVERLVGAICAEAARDSTSARP